MLRYCSTPRSRDERGVTIVLFALTLVVVLIFVAFAIDSGRVFNERRQDQSAADAAALAAAQTLATTGSRDQAASEAIRISWEDTKKTNNMTLAQWTSAWSSCSDPERDASVYTVVSSASPCISFKPDNTRVRVNIPPILVEATFGRVAGVNSFQTRAAAEAELSAKVSGDILPFGLPGAAAGHSEVCIKSTANGHDGTLPCSGSDSGNFGSLDSPLFGNAAMSTTRQCDGGTQNVLEQNIAAGIDHALDEFREAGDPSEAVRLDQCGVENPNHVTGQTGIGSALDPGMVSGSTYSNGPARLKRGSNAKRSVSGNLIDDRPLWEYMRNITVGSDKSTQVPAECAKSSITSKTLMKACLDEYKRQGYTTDLFDLDSVNPGDGTYDIQSSPRFAFVPELDQNTWGEGKKNYGIRAFRAVYIQTTYHKCNGNGCDIIFNPGEPCATCAQTKKDLDAVTALLIPDEALPQAIIDNAPGSQTSKSIALIK